MIAVGAVALVVGSAAFAQLSGQLDAAEQKLAQDSQSCVPINLGDYQSLLNEAAKNKKRAEKAKKAGVPVDDAVVDADLAKASDLFNRAVAAHVQQCVRQATGQGQTPAQPQMTPQTTPVQPAATSVTAPAPATGWIDTKTGKPVTSWPSIGGRVIRGMDPNQVFDSETGRNFARENGQWIDVKTGKRVASWPSIGGRVIRGMDPNQVFDSETGRNFARVEAPPLPPPPPANQAMNLSPFASGILAVHNATRAEFGAPPLKWDPAAADRAGAWAGELARIGRLEHSPREGRGTERENIGRAPLHYSAVQIVNLWVDERVDFVPGVFPNVCRSGAVCEGVLHFTQMIWPTTIAIGCGNAVGRGSQWVVCRYNPGGNKDGKMVGLHSDIPNVDFAVGPARGGLDVNVCSGLNQSNCHGPVGDIDLNASTNVIIDVLFKNEVESSGDADLSVLLSTLLDFGPDDGLSKYVGGGLGIGRVNHHLSINRSEPGLDDSDSALVRHLMGLDCPLANGGCETTVEQPELPNQEVFKPVPPDKLEDPM